MARPKKIENMDRKEIDHLSKMLQSHVKRRNTFDEILDSEDWQIQETDSGFVKLIKNHLTRSTQGHPASTYFLKNFITGKSDISSENFIMQHLNQKLNNKRAEEKNAQDLIRFLASKGLSDVLNAEDIVNILKKNKLNDDNL